jgi:hypothetical protein
VSLASDLQCSGLTKVQNSAARRRRVSTAGARNCLQHARHQRHSAAQSAKTSRPTRTTVVLAEHRWERPLPPFHLYANDGRSCSAEMARSVLTSSANALPT